MVRLEIRAAALGLTLVASGGLAVACSRQALGVFFDLPPQPAAVAASLRASSPAADTGHMPIRAAPVSPPIEATLNIDSAIALLPRDHAGNVDFAEALRRAIIRPRAVLPGRNEPVDTTFQFKFDFYFPGPDTLFDAYFPHSTHVQWIDCQQCHGRIFKYRGTVIRMADVLAGKYCGECHGKVSFSPLTECERCHTKFPMPPNRLQPEFIGTLALRRAEGDSSIAGTIEGNAAGVNTGALPVAQFPHWLHRIRYRCKACHLEVFEPKLGANRITMKAIAEGKFCGTCHNGITAFQPTIGNCIRCHVPQDTTRAKGGGS